METVEEFMTNSYPCCSSAESLKDVCNILAENNCSEIFIVDKNKKLIGAVSGRDIFSKCGSGADPSQIDVIDCMHKVPVIINAQMELEDCLTVLEHNNVESAPVVDRNGNYCGLISLNDIKSNFKE
ncbi:CBS domain-containing protein [Peredibacter starrii]|uniref:CBS domain-containing protein n=1 Tax=Peredibacter starrii TaxID=28202 RepID=A0AAX4HTN6_9BACT|nr:CBS domain-containing protein [Peredibacter starrii]WPU66560.1 CBS domain-containing protein [Peredibacter starrii]